MSNSASSALVPVAAKQVGGALVNVLDNLELYVEPRTTLNAEGIYAVVQVITDNPELNNELGVDLVVNALARHRIDTVEISGYVEKYGIKRLSLMLDFLREVGEIGDSATMPLEGYPQPLYKKLTLLNVVVEAVTDVSQFDCSTSDKFLEAVNWLIENTDVAQHPNQWRNFQFLEDDDIKTSATFEDAEDLREEYGVSDDQDA